MSSMSYKTYEEYKESSIKWVNKIPKNWDCRSLGSLFYFGRGRVISNEEIAENQGKFPVYSSQTKNDGILGYIDTYDFQGEYVTWTTDGANAGTVFYREGKFNCTNVCGTIKPKEDIIQLKYLPYFLNLATKEYVRQDINPKLMNDVMSSIKICFPINLSEQIKIVNYLDKKTSEIDKNIAKNKELISLLEEKKVALINQCVTKGLNPNVPMKDSGIEWIGKIPEHWESHRIKDFLTFKIGGTPSTSIESYFEGDNVWVSIADLSSNKGEFISDSSTKISDDGVKFSNVKKISKGSLLYSFKLSVGLTAFAGCDLYTNEAIASFEHNDFVDLNFLKYVFKVGFENNAFENIYGAKLFNSDLIKFAKFVLPIDIEEQKQIANYLDIRVNEINLIINKINSQIELLEEYKQSLIHHVVTGKVDVREVEV